ncbi:hypothetical protein [Nocardia sp. NBC_00511]|uniref:hypothetical protein n=1 Tax=Nocardia sp. NBC_00511 TaxID=2903591 RepID=UPI0030E58343
MIIEIEQYGAVAVEPGDDAAADYVAAQQLTASEAATGATDRPQDVRVLVEVQRRLGGIAPRALLGGRFVTGPGDTTRIAVAIAGFDALGGDGQPTCDSRLWRRPFTSGLPSDFGGAVLESLTKATDAGLPAGTLTVDRAGFDEINSSEVIFAQAAAFLRLSIAALLDGRDPEPLLRSAIEGW